MTDIKQIAIIVGIAVVFTAFVIVAMEAFYESPQYDKVCNTTAYYGNYYATPAKPTPENFVNESCGYVYETPEVKKCYSERGAPDFNYTKDKCPTYLSCNFCGLNFEESIKKHDNISFIILAIVGIASIIFGVLYKIEFLGSGFMYGGIAVLFYATMRYLGQQNKYLRVFILFVELLVILWIGYKKLYKKKQS
mgnify:CR=1 FL=1